MMANIIIRLPQFYFCIELAAVTQARSDCNTSQSTKTTLLNLRLEQNKNKVRAYIRLRNVTLDYDRTYARVKNFPN